MLILCNFSDRTRRSVGACVTRFVTFFRCRVSLDIVVSADYWFHFSGRFTLGERLF